MARNMRDIVFASFNLHNLQLPGAPMYPRSRPYSEEEFEAKLAWGAAMLQRLDADVIERLRSRSKYHQARTM